MEVSTGLKETVFTVSMEVGQARSWMGALVDRERSYIEIPEECDAAKAGED